MKKHGECFKLNNGVEIPCIGYGTYKAAEGKSSSIIRMAIDAGYRYFDTAAYYGTEEYLGEAIAESGLPREQFFITSKVWKADMGYENVKQAFSQSLERLKTDYLDLYLIHWPVPHDGYEDWKVLDLETWRGMEELYHEGKIRAIGVSNFLPHHLLNLMEHAEVMPAVDQIEFHPGYTQDATVQFCQEHQIQVQAWSPIGRMRMMQEPVILEMAERYGVSPVQVCLRYALQRQVIPIPKSSAMERMKQNLDLFGFEISKEDMWKLTTLPPMGWSGEHPDRYRVKVSESTERY